MSLHVYAAVYVSIGGCEHVAATHQGLDEALKLVLHFHVLREGGHT